MRIPAWIAMILVLAAAQVLFGLAGIAWIWWTGTTIVGGPPQWVHPVQMVVFSCAAALLIRNGREDKRAVYLGAAFALIAASFAYAPARVLERSLGSPVGLAVLRGLRIDALLPLFVWLFFRDFPRGISGPRVNAIAGAGVWLSGGLGIALIAANAMRILGPELFPALDATDRQSSYWGFVYGVTALALPLAGWKMRGTPAEERRRASIFATGLVAAAFVYSFLILLFFLLPELATWRETTGRHIIYPIAELVILSIPLTTAYAVLVDRALPVRLLIRNALQYNLSRVVVTLAAGLPLAFVVWYLYGLRAEPLQELASGSRPIALLAASAFGAAAFRVRGRARQVIDRTFFREAYDARQMLLDVAAQSRRASRAGELGELLAREIDRALHLERVAVLFTDPVTEELRSAAGNLRALSSRSALATRFAGHETLVVDLEDADSPLLALPNEDRHWLADGGVRLLVPMLSSGGELIGLLALGAKRSELPFSGEDRSLLAAIAASGAVTLESRLRADTPTVRRVDTALHADAAARSCRECGVVDAGDGGERCGTCGGELTTIALPVLLHGKFRVERKIGEGGMGVVYRARDVELDRTVAIKTLPATSPEESAYLRREARAMAAVLHPNLAIIYSAETWKGSPILVTEFLEGGTLSQHIEKGPLPLAEVAELGLRLAEGLERIHAAGILHRDVKPSNIGFTGDGVPKLLDFGVARMTGDAARAAPADPSRALASRRTSSHSGLVGTPLYMSPEAIAVRSPDAGFDLWSLAIVLYEALTGINPVERRTWAATLQAIASADVRDLRERLPECPEELAAFFRQALHGERRQRPQSAQELRARWREACSAVLRTPAPAS